MVLRSVDVALRPKAAFLIGTLVRLAILREQEGTEKSSLLGCQEVRCPLCPLVPSLIPARVTPTE
jgi:hypothetical protein